MAADTPSLMGSAVRPAEPLGSISKRKEGPSSTVRRRANSSLPELVGISSESHAVHGAGEQPDSQSNRLVGANRQFDANVRNLILPYVLCNVKIEYNIPNHYNQFVMCLNVQCSEYIRMVLLYQPPILHTTFAVGSLHRWRSY